MSTAPLTNVCRCGSGLPADRCCSLDPAAGWPQPASAPEITQAQEALQAADYAGAETPLLALLGRSPLHVRGLWLLHRIRHTQRRRAASEALLKRIVAHDRNNLPATHALALLLFEKSDLLNAEVHARNGVRLAPLDAQSHNLIGMITTELHRPQVGEHHYRRAMELLAQPSPILIANLAWNLKNQGRIAEARALYEQSVSLDPNIFQTLFGWASMEESDRNFTRAGELLDAAERLAPGHPRVHLQRAILLSREGRLETALAVYDGIERRRKGPLTTLEAAEKGRLLDRMGRHADAFAAYDASKRRLREATGQAYLADEAAGLVEKLKGFFVRNRLSILPRASARQDVAQPIFVVGFPRSGTTMVEQTLTSHPMIAAGDELPIVNEIATLLPRMFASPLPYPLALADLSLGDHLEGLDNLRDYYLQRARQLRAPQDGKPWFTDKMPLNEMHLGLIGLMFPRAPIVHLIRHPLDVVLSVFSNHLTHGFYCAYALESAARHYALIMDLVYHYRREMDLRYYAVRYEQMIEDQEGQVRALLDFVGMPFDERCLSFHENRRYARTASYAQVTEKLYDRSRYRYRDYRRELEPATKILEPVIHRLGYSID